MKKTDEEEKGFSMCALGFKNDGKITEVLIQMGFHDSKSKHKLTIFDLKNAEPKIIHETPEKEHKSCYDSHTLNFKKGDRLKLVLQEFIPGRDPLKIEKYIPT